MKQTRIGTANTVVVLIMLVAVIAAGCDCPKRLEALQRQNKMLSKQIADLEKQLAQADAAAANTTTPVQAAQVPADESVYTVVEGDNLWSIAKKKLGKGSRYEEILALNPQISKDEPLAIGTVLKLPPR